MKYLFLFLATLLVVLGNLSAQVNLDSGLVAYYPFNGNANDESGNGNNGTVIGAVLTSDRFGNDSSAYEFDGTSTYITIPSSTTLESPTIQLSQVAWIYAYSWSLIGQAFGPVTMKSNSGTNAFQYRLSVGVEGINTAINNWNNAVTILDTLNFNEWYMIVTTLKDDTVRAYINNVFIGLGTLTGPINQDNLPLEIGRDVPGATEIFHGKIDDIRIYNRALIPDEIDSLYNSIPTSIDNPSALISRSFELYQNYPNPFNPITTIRYSLPKALDIKIDVFDVVGQRVMTLVQGKVSIGYHKVEFDGGDLASGVYFCMIQAGDFIRTRKMLLMK
jgi:hypothetical protein